LPGMRPCPQKTVAAAPYATKATKLVKELKRTNRPVIRRPVSWRPAKLPQLISLTTRSAGL